jgi:uncharacterized membrane protein HdeD (DUF308 family)
MITAAVQAKTWWLILLQGIAGILLGAMLVTDPAGTTLVIVALLGFYWLFMGILALVRAFVDESVPWIWSLLIGIVGILAGLSVIKHPLLAAIGVPTAIVIILGLQGLIMGVFEIIGAFAGGGVGSFILGAIYVVIAILLLGSPIMASLAVPTVFGVLLLVQGAALIILAIRLRA